MYLLKAKKNTEQLDQQEIQEKLEKHAERVDRLSSSGSVDHVQETEMSAGFELNVDELPDGACISPKRKAPATGEDQKTGAKEVSYIGSFSVLGEDQNARSDYVRKQLTEMRNVTKSKPVLLVISLSGIKVCSESGESVHMAHALKRISYATCDPENCQFSFLAREPKGQSQMQYCHAFITKSSEEAEELNTIVGNAFKMAYAYQRQDPDKGQPTFHELIEQQIEVQQKEFEEHNQQQKKLLEERLNQISTAKVDQIAKERKERRRKQQEELEKEKEIQRLHGKDRTTWAKHMAGKTKHRAPYVSDTQQSTASPKHDHVDITKCNGDLAGASPVAGVSPFRSITALQEALDSCDRTYGSPVMTLKATIDSHYSQNGRFSFGEDPNAGNSSSSYLYPVMHSTPPGEQQKQSNLSTRPLPATPDTDKKVKAKNRRSSSGQRSSSAQRSSSGQRSSSSQRSSPSVEPRLSNGHSTPPQNGSAVTSDYDSPRPQLQRPLSGKYQNDSPTIARNGNDVTDDGNVYAGPPTPLRYDSLKKLENSDLPVEEELSAVGWYQAGIPREIALEILAQEEIGSFIVRDSTSHPNCYALSVKVPKFDNPMGISHYLILRSSKGGFKLKGLEKEWPTLTALVTHHTVMPEMLPCTLRLPRNTSNPAFRDSDKDERTTEEDEDYQKLSDFSNMMADLKM